MSATAVAFVRGLPTTLLLRLCLTAVRNREQQVADMRQQSKRLQNRLLEGIAHQASKTSRIMLTDAQTKVPRVAFTCGHTFLLPILEHDIIPSFQEGLSALPVPVTSTAAVLMAEYKQLLTQHNTNQRVADGLEDITVATSGMEQQLTPNLVRLACPQCVLRHIQTRCQNS